MLRLRLTEKLRKCCGPGPYEIGFMKESVRYQINAPHIVHEVFDDTEAAIINLKNGNYYSLDTIGAELWQLLEAGATVPEMTTALAARYDATPSALDAAARNFVATLQTEDLIIPVPAANGTTAPNPTANCLLLTNDGPKKPFAPPVLERYNDMQELLLLDPIHEVEEAGWPQRVGVAQ